MANFRVSLADVRDHQNAVEACEPGDSLNIYGDRNDARYWLVTDNNGEALGTLPRRGKLIDAVVAGGKMLSAEVQDIRNPTEAKPWWGLRIDVSLAEAVPSSPYEAGLAALTLMSEPTAAIAASRAYRCAIVGESNYQPAILRCLVGQSVQIVREYRNPFDADAVAVVSEEGATIGYLGRDNWLREAILEEDAGCLAVIDSLERGDGGHVGVVLRVETTADVLPVRIYTTPAAPSTSELVTPKPHGRKGWLARLFGN